MLEREKGVCVSTKSVREAGDRGAVKPVKRNAIVFDIPVGSIEGFWGYRRSHSNCNADLLHVSPTLFLSHSLSLCFSNSEILWSDFSGFGEMLNFLHTQRRAVFSLCVFDLNFMHRLRKCPSGKGLLTFESDLNQTDGWVMGLA